MRMMCRVMAFLLGVSILTENSYSISLEDLGTLLVKPIVEESLNVWGISDSNDFIPHRVGIKVCKAENTVLVGFYLSQRNIDFYRQKFSDGKRKPIGFELDVIDRSGVFVRDNLESIGYNASVLLSTSYVENYMLDGEDNYTVTVNNPSIIPSNTWMFWKFKFSKHREINPAEYEVQAQLTGNLRTLYSEHLDVYFGYSNPVKDRISAWLGGNMKADGNDFFNLRKGQQVFWNDTFFQKGDRKVHQFVGGEEERQLDFVPYACDFGPDPYGPTGVTQVPNEEPMPQPSPPSLSDLPKQVTAGKANPAPNLTGQPRIAKENKDEDSNKSVPIGKLYCKVEVKNTTSTKVGPFDTKCTLYDGLRAGNDSPISLGSKAVSGGLGGNAKTSTYHSFEIKHPGYYTLYACVNTGSNPPKETSTSDNCNVETFSVFGNPDVRVQSVVIQGGGASFLIGSTITVVSDFANDGDNFIAGKNRKMTVSAELSGCVPTQVADVVEMSDDILSTGASGKTKTFTVTIPPTATPGTCTVSIVADPKGELTQSPNQEEHRENNRKSITFAVVDPTPPPENCDLVISSGGLTGDRTTLKQGDSYGYKARLLNTGSVQCPSDTRLSYFEKGPGDTDWRYIDGDSTPASKLLPGQSNDERMLSDTLVAHVLGSYQGKICADTDNANIEKDEGNNCFLMSFSVVEGPSDPGTQPPPSGTTDPDDDDVIFSIIFD